MKTSKSLFSRKGAMVIMLIVAIGTASFTTANKYFEEKAMEYRIAVVQANSFRAFLLARAGMQGAMGALKKIPEEVLYQSGIAFNPPPVPLAGGTIYYRMSPEDGKINVNNLVKQHDQSPNLRIQDMMLRLYEQFGIMREKVVYLVDWIDENDEGIAEKTFYQMEKPIRKIKNGPLYTLSELASVRGYDRKLIYESLKPVDYEKNYSQDFLSEEEKVLVTDSDFILANNITAFIPFKDTADDRININAAPYHVLMSLSDFMTRQAAMRILKYKIEKGGYIKEYKDLEKFAEFQIKTSDGFTLFSELTGEQSGGTGQSQQQQQPNQGSSSQAANAPAEASLYGARIKSKGEIYKIVGVGSVGKAVRKVTCIYDLPNDQILLYTED
jgi:general secretion pathway protein K